MQEEVQHLTLAQAAKLSPGRPSTCAVWRWCRVGIKARTGQRIRLEHIRAGGRIFTTESDLQVFFDRVAAGDREHFDAKPAPVSKSPTSRQRQASIDQADRTLRSAGIV